MATGKKINSFDIEDVSGGCNYSDDATALTKNQSPDSMNVEFFNGRLRKRLGYLAVNAPKTGQGGIDSSTKLMLHMNGVNGATTFTDSELTPKTVTAHQAVSISTDQSKFGGASGKFMGSAGIDSYVKLLLHMDGIDGSTTFTDSELTPKTVTANGEAAISTTASKFGGASGYLNSGNDFQTSLMLHCDGVDTGTVFTDSSASVHTATPNGDVQTKTAVKKFGTSSALFDGTGDYLTISGTLTDFEMDVNDFTFDFWYQTSTTGTDQSFFSRQIAASGSEQINILFTSANKFRFYMRNASSTFADYITTSAVNTGDGQWHHYAVVRSGTSIYMFIDGVSQTLTVTSAVGSTPMDPGTGSLYIGQAYFGGENVNGYMDEIRVSKAVARWTANFTPPLREYSTGDSLTAVDSTDWDFGTGDFTIDFWTKSFEGAGRILWFVGQTEFSVGRNAFVCQTNADGSLFFGAEDVSTGVALAAYSTTTPITLTDAFHHLAFVRSGSNFYIFVDGVSKTLTASTPISTNSLGGSTGVLSIGALAYNGYLRWFNGFLDEMRISKGIARWTSNFTPPTSAYALPGYLTLADTADFDISSNDFTFDFWVKRNTVSGTVQYFGGQSDSTLSAGIGFLMRINADNTLGFLTSYDGTTLVQAATSSTIADTSWHHVAFVRSTTNLNIYIDGISGLTYSISTNTIFNSTNLFSIGSAGEFITDYCFDGYLDEFRFSKGLARWTTTFTPPSLAYDTFNASIPQIGFSLIDFSNTSSYHQQVAHFGTSVYAYDRITDSSITLREGAPYTRSYNAKVGSYLIQSYQDYSVPYYWDGAAASMTLLSGNAPGFKRTIEFQGYLLGMNTSANKTRCYYQAIGNIIGGGAAYTDYFTLTPAPNDDEITDPFLLNGRLYAGTRYGIFRISFVGGVTVFEFKQVISDIGVVPDTTQTVITKQYGQVALFLGTDKRLYMFDGANVKSVSDLYFYRNNSTPISMDLIDDNYKENAFAVYDITQRVYRLFVTKSASSTNYYGMNIDVDTFAYYPFDNMQFCSGCICYDTLLRPFLICADYTGQMHKMFIDNPTDNGTAINEYYKSPIVSIKNNTVKKGTNIDIVAVPTSNANLQVYDRIDFERAWSFRKSILMASTRDKFLGRTFVLGSSKLGSVKDLINAQLSINATFNFYQFQLYSDNPTVDGWEVQEITVDQEILKFGKAEAQR